MSKELKLHWNFSRPSMQGGSKQSKYCFDHYLNNLSLRKNQQAYLNFNAIFEFLG